MDEIEDEITLDIAVFLKTVLANRKLRNQLLPMPEFVQMCRHVAPNMELLLTMLGEYDNERAERYRTRNRKNRKENAPCLTTTT